MALVLQATMEVGCSLLQKDLNWYRRTSLLIIELLIILTIFQEFVYSSDLEFVAHPDDLSVKEGESGSFNCILKSSLPFAAAKSYWENGLTDSIHDSAEYNVTTTSNNISKTISSHLTINNARRDMSKLYKCWLVLKITNNSPTAVSSEFASLDVLYFLNNEDLHCRGPSGPMIQEGNQVAVECEGVQTNPQAVLRWLGPLSVHSSFYQTGSLLVGNFTVSPSLHNNVLICVAESEAFPEEQVNCSLGPYVVIHSPIVEVVPHQAEMIWPSVSQMQFQCKATGYPQANKYKWLCHPEKLFKHCTSNSQNLTITLDAVETEETLNISCEATNEVATSRNSSNVNVRYLAKLDVCKAKSKYVPSIDENGVPVLLYDDTTNVLKCLTEVKSIMKEVTFQWYLDGLLIAQSKGDHEIIKSSDGSSHLLVYNSLKVIRRGVVACNIKHEQYHDCSLDQLLTCNLSRADPKDPTSSITKVWYGTTKFMITVAIATGCGLLFCLILTILASLKLKICRRTELNAYRTDASLSDFEGISSVHGVTSQNQHGVLPLYEIPEIDLGGSTSMKKSFTGSHFGTGRHVSADNFLEPGGGGEEEQEEEGGEEEASFPDSESNPCSSVEKQDMSFLSDDTNESHGPVISSNYENGEVVESVLGNTRSRYFWAKTTPSGEGSNVPHELL